MTLDEFVAKGWADHGENPEGVFDRLPEGLALVSEARHLPAFAGLAVHVAGEHLGRWKAGLDLLSKLEALPVFDVKSAEGKSVQRSKAVLHLCAGDVEAANRAIAAGRSGGDVQEASDRIRVLSIAASALGGQKRLGEARRAFEEALTLAAYGPNAADPAAKALAVTGNNLAAEFESRPSLSPDEVSFMLRAANAGRDWWGVAGGWMEVERAEYRLAKSLLKAGDTRAALLHAGRCLAGVHENGDDPGEAFFAHEVMALASLAAGDREGAVREKDAAAAVLPTVTDVSFRAYCGTEFEKLDAKVRSHEGQLR